MKNAAAIIASFALSGCGPEKPPAGMIAVFGRDTLSSAMIAKVDLEFTELDAATAALVGCTDPEYAAVLYVVEPWRKLTGREIDGLSRPLAPPGPSFAGSSGTFVIKAKNEFFAVTFASPNVIIRLVSEISVGRFFMNNRRDVYLYPEY